ncbi:MAG: hypothetical protein JSW64_00890 [Candidatus Zixiibacteriota bacterium]|nr:MAG: hypothetical protein JSW64_00890 [candidate division Zixibacteria bacterium]
MISNDRISRKQRLKTSKNRNAGIALVLAVILLLLVVGGKYRTRIGNALDVSALNKIFQKISPDDVDSLVFQTARSFGLNSLPEVNTAVAGSSRVRFTQLWPSRMPLVIYARRIRELSGKSGIGFDFTQFGEKDSLVCELFSRDDIRKEVVVIPDRKAALEGRFLGIILKDIYKLEHQEIVSITKSKIPFGYLAKLDVFPAGDIKTQLHSEWAASILNVSVSHKDLVRYDLLKSEGKSDYPASALDLLGRYPNLALVRFERSDDTDYLFVEAFIDRAKEHKIGYIYDNRTPDRIDSLAFSAGLTFISHGKIVDYTGKSFAEIRTDLVAELVGSKNPNKTIITIDISKIQAQKLVDLIEYLMKIGIKILYINKLNDHPEFMTEDL